MTEKFYSAFLDYLSPKEKQRLCSTLEKKKVRVNGFRMLKDVPSRLFAPHIVRNEQAFFSIILNYYSPSYSNDDEAVEAFSPDTAVMCLAHFIKEKRTDEPFLLSLLKEGELPETQNEVSSIAKTDKAEKKNDAFRQKYLVVHKELTQTKKQLEIMEGINLELKAAIDSKDGLISELESKVEKLQKEYEEEVRKHRTNTLLGKSLTIMEDNEDVNPNNKILVLSPVEYDIEGVDHLEVDDISRLMDMHMEYQDIVFVANDVPFSIKRYLAKLKWLRIECTRL